MFNEIVSLLSIKSFSKIFFLEKYSYSSILKNFTLFHHKGAIIIFFEFFRQPTENERGVNQSMKIK